MRRSARASLPEGAKVLDIGCGQGVALKHFAADKLNAVGIAIGEDVRICCEKGYNAVEMDLSFLDFEDETFDLVWSRHVLEHSIFPYFSLAETYRVLKPGGILYMEVPAPDTAANHQSNPITTPSWVARCGSSSSAASAISRCGCAKSGSSLQRALIAIGASRSKGLISNPLRRRSRAVALAKRQGIA